MFDSNSFGRLFPVLCFLRFGQFQFSRFLVWQVEFFAVVEFFKTDKTEVKAYFEMQKPWFRGRELCFQNPKIMRSAKITSTDVPNQLFGVGDEQGFYGVRFFLPL